MENNNNIMDIELIKPTNIEQNQIFVNKAKTSPNYSEFSRTLAIYEKGQISSLSSFDLALYADTVPHKDIPWDLFQLVYERSSLVYNAVNNTADFAIQAGFDFDTSADAKRKIMEWMDKVNFELLLKNIFIQLQIFGNAYLDVSDMNFPKLLPPKTMMIRVQKGGNNDGMVIGYRQMIDAGIKSIEFTPDEIIHFKNNDACNVFYGMSEIKPVLGSLTRYVNWTEDLGQILHRFAAPYLHHKIGTDTIPATQAQLDAYKDILNNRLSGEDLVTSSAVEIEIIQATKGMMQVDGLVKGLQDEIIAGLRIPEIFARGGITSNKAVGDVEMQAFDRKVKALQKVVTIPLEDYLFPKITKGKVKMVWNEFSAEGEKVRAERLQLMVASGIPLQIAIQMIGWGTWSDEIKSAVEEEQKKAEDSLDQIQAFQPSEKPQEELAMQVVTMQKIEYRDPIMVTVPIETSLSSQKDMFRNPIKR